MTVVDLNNYMLNHNYIREYNSWSKDYEISDEEHVKNTDGNKLTIIYRLNKQFVNVYHKKRGTSKKVMKARLKNITINKDGSLDGLKSLI